MKPLVTTITTVCIALNMCVASHGVTMPQSASHAPASPALQEAANLADQNAAREVQVLQHSRAETDEEKQNRLAVQLGIALGLKIGTRPAADDDFGSSFLKELVNAGADALIESTVDEAFSGQTRTERRQIGNMVKALFEGDLTFQTVGERNRKQEIYSWLRQKSPDAANSAQVIDFIYEVCKRTSR